MALISSHSRCALCKERIDEGRDWVGFGPFVANALDRAYVLTDAAVHTSCLSSAFSPDGVASIMRARERKNRSRCTVCGQVVGAEDVHFGFVSSEPSDPLFALNWTALHQECIGQFHSAALLGLLEARTADTTRWRGPRFTVDPVIGWNDELPELGQRSRTLLTIAPRKPEKG